jgi:hypothetical protein
VDVKRVHDGNQEIMGKGAGNCNALQSDRYRISLGYAHPDGKVAFGILLFEDGDAILISEAHADTVDYAFDHFSHYAPIFLFVMVVS